MTENESSGERALLDADNPVAAPAREKLLVAGSAAGGLGGALAAIFAALCCIGPASVAILGAGGGLAAARLTPYRPVLLVLSAGLLAVGFWRAYGQRVVVNGQSCPVRVGRLARTVLWVAALVWLAAAVVPAG
jgi:mercuric ion transport protein